MLKLKYLNLFVAACGAIVLVIGSIIGIKGVIKGEGAKTWFAAISFMLGGTALQAAALNRFFKYQLDEKIERTLKQQLQPIPTPCRGCRNFHGLEYGGVKLVCAIHPLGVEGDICPDHDKFSKP
ncbi:hypothetical protein [Aulosira sp. FACHB-615]|uniref:hypothetical protein n=1 Tax=Aulosira sp. FACHB-615 TaxID=2692777 RepID=UPI001682DE2F|nr:hypothetical protein [Aulosira sp. FACHB-615]MBD2491959.1 hypothetical protein [Aulosira sp. FACHB-615]